MLGLPCGTTALTRHLVHGAHSIVLEHVFRLGQLLLAVLALPLEIGVELLGRIVQLFDF